MKIDHQTVQELLSLLRRRYPGWKDCDDPRFVKRDRAPKRAMVERAARELAWRDMESLLRSGRHEELLQKVERLLSSGPLLYKGKGVSGDLSMLRSRDVDRRALAEAIVSLVHGAAPSPERLEEFIAFQRRAGVTPRWALPTALLYLCHPESEIFVKPNAASWLLGLVGRSDAWSRTPSPATYAAVLHASRTLLDMLRPFGARDMVDMLAILLVASREAESTRYWKITPGSDGEQWEECRTGGFIGVGWELFGDISQMTRAQFDKRYQEIIRSFPELKKEPEWSKRTVGQLWTFAQISVGDVVMAGRGAGELLGTGRVTAPYHFVPGSRNAHRLSVVWSNGPSRTINEPAWKKLLVELDRERFGGITAPVEPDTSEPAPSLSPIANGVHESPGRYRTGDESKERTATVHPAYSLEQMSIDSGYPLETLQLWTGAIERKGQAILYGPPGTGKTWLAQRLARHVAGGGDGIVRMVQFHPGTSYEEFIIGLRPRTREDGAVEYPLVPGEFLRFCEEARARTARSVLVIDEINRANVAGVLGELMYLLEYRGMEVSLSSGSVFSVPENVRVIGTMNTADRSIALVDHALRRRFAFLSIRPDYEVLRRFHAASEPALADRLVDVLKRINKTVGDPAYELGISYFLRSPLVVQLEEIWKTEIEPYLEELFFDRPAEAKSFSWEAVSGELLG